ncbi:hypothetical protein NP493_127g04024 [Ridgeia piscesae]|uniref:CUB domain-containing protein n=1 Tax=Ridgeia piscesae TaxID=27915 RepID=A0AAD9UGI2_RIDPI|nr:hypothetical protein NP493_127g04024 [Ridgeia piscesae]
MVVLFADIRCPDGLELFNYAGSGHAGYHLATVCGRKRKNKIGNDNTAIYSDTNGAYVTFRTFPGRKRGAGFIIRYTLVDPEDRTCTVS